tara:strand:- start:4408 stop:5358 length:951 start_codon:yes stop_codon:yes gene_type:complete
MKILINPGTSKNIITIIALGEDYYANWYKHSYPCLQKYCKNHKLGLIVFDKDLISKDSKLWKKATWQKLLIAETLKNSSLLVENICNLDADILVNHNAPNIFDKYDPNTIGLVSMINNLPFSLTEAQRKVSFLRHRYYDKKYPLDSSILANLEQRFTSNNLPPQKDYACSGVVIFNVKNHANLMRSWFEKYDSNKLTLSSGEQQLSDPIFNYEFQKWGKISWLDYKFQALWNFEMAIKYPFLYKLKKDNDNLIRECIEASLMTNYFLHFAGLWYESDMFEIGGVLGSEEKKSEIEDYYRYLATPVSGVGKGVIKPS